MLNQILVQTLIRILNLNINLILAFHYIIQIHR